MFNAVEPALAHLSARGAPIVIKADGLAAGKGVTVAMSRAEAEAAIRDALDGRAFGEAGASVLPGGGLCDTTKPWPSIFTSQSQEASARIAARSGSRRQPGGTSGSTSAQQSTAASVPR